MTFNKGIIKIDIVGNKNFFLQQVLNFVGNFFKFRCSGYHVVIDAGHRLDVVRDLLTGIDQRFKFFNYFVTIEDLDGNFGDAMRSGKAAGSFYVDDSIQNDFRF